VGRMVEIRRDERWMDAMTRDGGHAFLGVCSPFEEAGGLISNFMSPFKSFMGK